MKVKLNNTDKLSGLLVKDQTPIIVSFEDTSFDETRYNIATLTLPNTSFSDGSFLEIDGYRFEATDNYLKLRGRRFIASNGDLLYRAHTVVDALNSVSELSMKYDIYVDTTDSSIKFKTRKAYGSIPRLVSNIGATMSGTSYINSLANGAKAYVDVFIEDEHITTLEKDIYGGNTRFNLSPILSPNVDYDESKSFSVIPTLQINGATETYERITADVIKGYESNAESNYYDMIETNNVILPLINQRPNMQEQFIKYYIYSNKLVFSLYSKYERPSYSFYVTYYNSMNDYIGEHVDDRIGVAEPRTSLKKGVNVVEVDLNETWLRKSTYIIVHCVERSEETSEDSSFNIRYDVIRPINGCHEPTRIYWHNSFGGVSFCDFVGERQVDVDLDTQTYEKSRLSYYTDKMNERTVAMNKDLRKRVTVKTHKISKEGTYGFYDLAKSLDCWTTYLGKQYKIIVTDVTVNEENVGVYTVSVTFEYSLGDNY